MYFIHILGIVYLKGQRQEKLLKRSRIVCPASRILLFMGGSCPHLVKLLENGTIPFTKAGRHRRVRFEDVNNYREKIKAEQGARIIEIMRNDEESGLYV
ncbi:MAG: excisionase family DNA-binding protein [Cyclobacteriaceae bacterium]